MKFELPPFLFVKNTLHPIWRRKYQRGNHKALISTSYKNNKLKKTFIFNNEIIEEEKAVDSIVIGEKCFSKLLKITEEWNIRERSDLIKLNVNNDPNEIICGYKEEYFKDPKKQTQTLSTSTHPEIYYKIPDSLKFHLLVQNFYYSHVQNSESKFDIFPHIFVLNHQKDYFILENDKLTISTTFKSKNKIIVTRVNEKLNLKRKKVLPIRIKQQFNEKYKIKSISDLKTTFHLSEINNKINTDMSVIITAMYILSTLKNEFNRILKLCEWADIPIMNYFTDENIFLNIMDHSFGSLLARNEIIVSENEINEFKILNYFNPKNGEIEENENFTINGQTFCIENEEKSFRYQRGLHSDISEVEIPFHFSFSSDMPKLDQFFNKEPENFCFGAELAIFQKFYTNVIKNQTISKYLKYWVLKTKLLSEELKIFLILKNEAYMLSQIEKLGKNLIMRNMNILFIKNADADFNVLRKFNQIYIHDEDNYFYHLKSNDKEEPVSEKQTIKAVSIYKLPISFLHEMISDTKIEHEYFYTLVKKNCDIVGVMEIYRKFYESKEEIETVKEKIPDDELLVKISEDENNEIDQKTEPIYDAPENIGPSINNLVNNIYALTGIKKSDTLKFAMISLCDFCKTPNILKVKKICGLIKINKCRRCFSPWGDVEGKLAQYFRNNSEHLKKNDWMLHLMKSQV